MISTAKNSDRQDVSKNTEPHEYRVVVSVIKVVIVVVFLLPLAEYLLKTKIDSRNVTIENEKVGSTTEILDTKKFTGNIENVKNPQVYKRKGPTWRFLLFEQIIKELVEKCKFCNATDFPNSDKHVRSNRVVKEDVKRGRKEEPVPAIVNYAVGIVLTVSLAAALLELYKAKCQPVKKDGKHSLSRKCSLADLTVMKHHRKEMIRRDSILEVPEECIYSKQMGQKPAPFRRQYSFPVGPSIPVAATTNLNLPTNGRRLSIQATTRYVPVVDGRPAAVLQGRRHSIVTDGRQPLIAVENDGSRGIFVADRPAERHAHARRVHRH